MKDAWRRLAWRRRIRRRYASEVTRRRSANLRIRPKNARSHAAPPTYSQVPQHLWIGPRARRRMQRQRVRRRAAAISAVAILLGVPGARLGLNALSGLGGGKSAAATASSNGIETSESASTMLRFRSKSFRSRPIPQPATSTTPAAYEAAATYSMTQIIVDAASEYGLSSDYLIGVAICESHLNPTAYNPAGYHGLFQFDFPTWAEFGYGSIYDPVAQARTAARLLAAGEYSRWPNCS